MMMMMIIINTIGDKRQVQYSHIFTASRPSDSSSCCSAGALDVKSSDVIERSDVTDFAATVQNMFTFVLSCCHSVEQYQYYTL
jgi:hypothetical protein